MDKQILLLTSDFPPLSGGIANYLHNICKLLDADAHVLAPAMTGSQDFDGDQSYVITRLPVNIQSIWSRNMDLTRKWITAVRRNWQANEKIIVAGGLASTAILWALFYLSFRLPVETVLFVYGGEIQPFSKWWRWPWRLSLRRIDRFVAISHFTQRLLEDGLGIERGRIQMLRPGVEAARFRQGHPIAVDGWPSDRLVILSVGRLVRHKGHDNVLQAVAQLVQTGLDVGYIIAGRGPEENRLRQLTNSLNLQDHVYFAGFVPEEQLADYYHSCDIFALVSREEVTGGVEGFGIVYLEAGAAGKPVVAGKGGGVEDAVADGQSGILVEPKSVDAITEAFRVLLADRDKRIALGQYGQKRVETQFDWSNRALEAQKKLGFAVE